MLPARSSIAWRTRFALSLMGAAGVGSLLRLWHLGRQVIVGDEAHLVRAVLGVPLPEILVTYRLTDVCLPVAGFARAFLEAGVPLSEWMLRGPVVASGLVSLLALPLAARAWTRPGPGGGPAAASAADAARVHLLYPWLIALSPALALYARIARSYAPATLFAVLAAFAFLAWWRGRGWPCAVAFVVAGALAVYFHLGVAPFVAAPFAFAAGELAFIRLRRRLRPGSQAAGERRDALPGWGAVFLVGIGLLAALATFLVPGWESLSAVLAAKPGLGRLQASTVLGAARLQAGTSSAWAALLFWGVAGRGLVRLWRRDRSQATYTAVLVASQLGGIVVLSPFGLAEPVVLSRYVLVALPLVLLWVAWGLAPRSGDQWPLAAGAPRRRLRWATAAIVIGALVATGPFVRPRFVYSSFLHAHDSLSYHAPAPTLPREAVPAVYRRLAEIPRIGSAEAIVELPAFPETRNRSLAAYQDIHRRAVILAIPLGELGDRRLGLENHVAPRPDDILATRGRFLVVHRDLGAEERAVELPAGRSDPWKRREENISRRFQAVAREKIATFMALWGPPTWDDGRALIWDLDRVRARSVRPASR